MPSIQINDAEIYYEIFGDDKPDRAPIVLIHGSTIDHNDWDVVGKGVGVFEG